MNKKGSLDNWIIKNQFILITIIFALIVVGIYSNGISGKAVYSKYFGLIETHGGSSSRMSIGSVETEENVQCSCTPGGYSEEAFFIRGKDYEFIKERCDVVSKEEGYEFGHVSSCTSI